MDLTVPNAASELSAAFLQAGITAGLTLLCVVLYRGYGKPYFAWWALAWGLYTMRMGAIITFLVTGAPIWLYWHQVTTGLTALALLWAALVFAQQLPWRSAYLALALFPPVWSYVAIYRMDSFALAAWPAVLFLSLATFFTAWAFFRHHRTVGSSAAAILAGSFFLWSLHHLDYPLLRARGAWNPWGYYLDIFFALLVGCGLLLLVLEDLNRGLATLSALSGDLQGGGDRSAVALGLVRRPLSLPAVRGSALFVADGEGLGRFVAGAGACSGWEAGAVERCAAQAVAKVLRSGKPEVVRAGAPPDGEPSLTHAYTAALPVFRGDRVAGAMVVVGDARDPFAALDARFLVALGQQVGAALENADLYRRVEARSAELQRLAARMVQQNEEERRRLSRELHDETAQVLAAINMELGLLREVATPEMSGRLDRARGLLGDGIRSIRSVTEHLRPSLLDDLGLVPALRAMTDEFGERSGLAVQFDSSGEAPELPPETELAFFRALQEALANVARHSEARRVTVSLDFDAEVTRLSVTDDGRGFDPGTDTVGNGRMGIVGMRERITALGGTLDLEGTAGQGVSLAVTIPVGALESPTTTGGAAHA